MKKQVLAVSAVLSVLLAGSALAEDGAGAGAYAGAAIGGSGVTKAWFGKAMTDNLSVEAGATSFGQLSHKPSNTMVGPVTGPFTANPATSEKGGNAITFTALAHANIGTAQPFVKAGFSGSGVGNGLLAGVGIDYTLAGQWKARLEAERHAGAGVTTVTAGAAYTF